MATNPVMLSSSASVVAARMAEAGAAWLASLSDEQRVRAIVAAPRTETAAERDRLTWFFTPTDHGGLTFHEQSPRSRGSRCGSSPQDCRSRAT